MKKELYLPYIQSKKITVMGLGLLGRGVGDTLFLANNGATLTVTDMKTKEQLESSLKELEQYKDIKYTLGGHNNEDFENKDFILKAAGVPHDSSYIAHAIKENIPVYMSAALLSYVAMKELPEVTVIGITGTRGKSTTTQLIAHILRENNFRVHLGGNVRGVANLPILDQIEDGDYLVLELDSWQLQGFGDMNISPNIAVFTSFLDDHMNYYKDDKEHYFNDKANIYRNQGKFDILVASPQAHDEIWKRDKKKEVFVPEALTFEMSLIGDHNVVSARLAYEVASQCGLDDESIRASIKSFRAVEGRLEDMGLIRGVHVYNDNNGTTGDATIAALKAINQKYNKKPILIMGGSDKGLPLAPLEEAIKDMTEDVIYLSGTGTEKISLPKNHEFEQIEECVQKAFELAKEGDVILYSPGFASFSKFFNNEYEKNDAFIKAVKNSN